ncbi:MAG: hypothetical protein ACPGIB_10150, partial [Paracoccaceae bacterium]
LFRRACGICSVWSLMIIKIVVIFLIVIIVLAMFGKAHILLPGRSKKSRCRKCGQLRIGNSCGCD